MRVRHCTLARLAGPVFLLAALLAGCKSVEVPKLPGVTPYRMVIQQGNFISDDMIAQLKPGMTKEQVRFVLGTPLVTDIFHADRWDYVFFRELANGKREQRNLSVVFQDSKLARVIGDLLPDPHEQKPVPLAKPAAEPKPEATAKPATEEAKPTAEGKPADAPKPAPAAKEEEPQKPAADQKSPEPQSDATTEAKQEPASDEKKERGFFGRMLEKIGL